MDTYKFILGVVFLNIMIGLITTNSNLTTVDTSYAEDVINQYTNTKGDYEQGMTETSANVDEDNFDRTYGSITKIGSLLWHILGAGFWTVGAVAVANDPISLAFLLPLMMFQMVVWISLGILTYDKFFNKKQD